jgi:hypothetical protein
MRTLRQGAHVCLIYDEPHAQFEALAPFFDEGLRNGERCIYIADDLAPGDVSSSLADYGIDVEGYAGRGALLVWGRDQWRQAGELRSARKAVQVLRIVEEAILAGYRGQRFAVEMTWTLGPDIDVARLRHWEATLDVLASSDLPVQISCQYSRTRLAPAVIDAGLATHPLAVRGASVRRNPFHAVPAVLDGSFEVRASDTDRANSMLGAFGWAAREIRPANAAGES